MLSELRYVTSDQLQKLDIPPIRRQRFLDAASLYLICPRRKRAQPESARVRTSTKRTIQRMIMTTTTTTGLLMTSTQKALLP